ncbi:hypothetical protein ACLFMI_04185 [Pseudonocardia nantongensis]|uniref:hypothetical protein n=1 Tax=Pseudonocardia nantongensis TaxID=1181885 RepID=UPI00397CB628
MDPLETVPPDAAGLLRRGTLLGAGLGRDEIDRLLRTGRLLTVRRGVYRLAGAEAPSAEAMHVLRARGVAPDLADGAVFGHVTAALALGLPVWGVPLDRLHVIRDRRDGGRVRARTHVHGAPLPEPDVVDLGGLHVTSAARTVADLARTLPAERALVTVDAALHLWVRRDPSRPPDPGATTIDEVRQVLTRFAGRRGVLPARRVLALADPRCESPGESRSRLRMRLAGLPAPVTQWAVPGQGVRTDFAWPGLGVVGEFDGRVKYGRALRPGDDLADVLWREKRREDRIRATGLTVVRWIWSEIADDGPGGMAQRLRTRLTDPTHPVVSRRTGRDGCGDR